MIEVILSGFLFLFIIVTLIASEAFGNKVISDLERAR